MSLELANYEDGAILGALKFLFEEDDLFLPKRPAVFPSLYSYASIFKTFLETLMLPNENSRSFSNVFVTFEEKRLGKRGRFCRTLAKFTINEDELPNLDDNNIDEGGRLAITLNHGETCQAVVKSAWKGNVKAYLEQSENTRLFYGQQICDIEFMEINLSNLVPYQRMEDALNRVFIETDITLVVRSILGQVQTLTTSEEDGSDEEDFRLPDCISDLNSGQQEAFKRCLNRPLSLITAPPGTGKTRLAATLAHHFAYANGLNVLLCAPSNNATDKLAEALAKEPTKNASFVRMYSKSKERLSKSFFLNEVPTIIKPFALHNMIRQNSDDEYDFLLEDLCGFQLSNLRDLRERELKILQMKDIVVTTCSGAGDPRLDTLNFDLVIIDEATQCLELECLIPIARGAERVILIGDAKQLGPVVENKKAVEAGYGESMFERLLPIHGAAHLTQQYRMHPTICEFPSVRFYNSKLETAIRKDQRVLNPAIPLIWPYGPVTWFDNSSPETFSQLSHSCENVLESLEVAKIVEHLSFGGITPERVGIIAMYRQQVTRLHITLKQCKGLDSQFVKNLKIGTVDSFQGQEKDIIILSCVRSNAKGNVGFLESERRLNVAITRAKYGLIIVGNSETLKTSGVWSELIEHCRKLGSIMKHVPFLPAKINKRTFPNNRESRKPFF